MHLSAEERFRILKLEDSVDYLVKKDVLRILKRVYRNMQTRSVREFQFSRSKHRGKLEATLKGFVWEKACQIVEKEIRVIENQLREMKKKK